MRRTKKLQDTLWTVMACLWLGVFPLLCGSYASITLTKWTFCLYLTGITLFLTLMGTSLSVYFNLKEKRPSLQGLHIFPAVLPFIVMLVWMTISAALSPYSDVLNGNGQSTVLMGAMRYEGLAAKGCYVLILVCLSLHPARLRTVLDAMGISVTVFTLVALLQYAGLNPFGLFPGGLSVMTNYEFQSTIGNIDLNTAWLSLAVPALWLGWITGQRPQLPVTIGAAAGTLLLCLMEVQSGLLVLILLPVGLIILLLRKPEYTLRCLIALAVLPLAEALRKGISLPWLDGGKAITFAGLVPMLPWLIAAAFPIALALLLHYCFSANRKTATPPEAVRRAPSRQLGVYEAKGDRIGKPSGRSAERNPVPIKFIALTLAMLLAAAILLLYALPLTEDAGTAWQIHEILHGHLEDDFGNYRPAVWLAALNMVSENGRLLLGTGPDTFWYAFTEYISEHPLALETRFDTPHNEYLSLLANTGLISLLAYLAGLVMVLIRIRKQHPRLHLPLLFGILGFAVQSFFGFSICLTSPMAWCFLGLAAAQNKEDENHEDCNS